MSRAELVPAQPGITINEALAAMLTDDAIDYINQRGAEIAALSAAEVKMTAKMQKLKKEIDELPQVQQLRKMKDKIKQVKAARTEQITKVVGVIEKEAGKKSDDAIDQLFGESPKQLKGR